MVWAREAGLRKVLVGDSASIIQFVLERILSREGYEVHYSKHPRDFIQKAKTLRPDLVFLQAEIAGGRAYRICEYMNRRPETRHIPIVLTTRITDTAKYEFASWPGVREVMRKPLSSQTVLQVVRRLESEAASKGEQERQAGAV